MNLAFSFGFTIDKNLGVNWPIGVSALLGRNSRLILTGGIIVGRTARLLSKYEDGKIYDTVDLQGVSEDQLTHQENKTKPFFAITYNFGGVDVN